MVSSQRVYNWYISLVAAACMVLYGYDASVYNAVLNSENWLAWFGTEDSPLDPESYLAASGVTAYTVGAIFGGWFLGGPVGDYFGRRVGMASGSLMVIIATFMQTFSPKHSIACFFAGRVLIGIGQGLALTSGPVYIGELAPPEIRGTIMSFWQMFYSVGSFIAYAVNYACTKHKENLGNWDWRMVIIFQLLIPVVIIAQIFFIPETPRWYIKRKNNVEAARHSLSRVRDNPQDVEDELMSIREAIEFEKEAISGSYSALWKDPSLRKRLALAFVINAGQQVTGQGSLNSYSTLVYKQLFNADRVALINWLNALFGIIFTLNATWTVDRFGRRWVLIVGALGMAMCMLIVATVGSQTPTFGDGGKTQPVGIAIVFLLFFFTFWYKPSWGATVWIWTSEVFSMNVRAQAVGMASQAQNVANLIFQQCFPQFLKKCSWYTFYFFMGINFLLAIFVYFFIPETKQIELEEIDALFGGGNHKEKGAELVGMSDARQASIGSKGGVGTEIKETD